MSRNARDIPKEIAAFGEKQFNDTSADLVEVLRVKASTIRKHFKRLQGVAFLVSVVERDRVRVYLFSTHGVLLLGENIEPLRYGKVRKTSRLIVKFEKPIPLTEEELRIEATQELKDRLSKSIRRVSRFLNLKEPRFPEIYVSRESLKTASQGFGLLREDSQVLLFDEDVLSQSWSEGVILRAALLSFLDVIPENLAALSSCFGNALAYSLISKESKSKWLDVWRKASKDTDLHTLVNHLVHNSETYQNRGYGLLLELLQTDTKTSELESWFSAVEVIHDSIEVSFGTEDTQAFLAFLKTLKKPAKMKKKMILPSIHLAPRSLCNPLPLGIELKISEDHGEAEDKGNWLVLMTAVGSKRSHLVIGDSMGVPVTSIEYHLNIDDIFPKPHGIMSAGRDILKRALRHLGVESQDDMTFSATLKLRESALKPAELAVLERLTIGSSQVVLDTIVGSPKRLESLIDSRHVLLLPDFNHLGLRPDFLISGPIEESRSVVTASCLESTLFLTEENAYGVVSAPGIWGRALLSDVNDYGVSLSPIVSVHSTHGLLRTEDTWPVSS